MPKLKNRMPRLCRDGKKAISWHNGKRIYHGAPGSWQPPKLGDRIGGGGDWGGGVSTGGCPDTGISGTLSICLSVHAGAYAGVTGGGCVSCNAKSLSTCLKNLSGDAYMKTGFGIVGAGAEFSISGTIRYVPSLNKTEDECE